MNLETLRYIKEDPKRLFSMLGSKGFLDWMPDEKYIRIQFKIAAGYPLNLAEPKTFNEKLQWLSSMIASRCTPRLRISTQYGNTYQKRSVRSI